MPLPTFSQDDVVNFQVTEALVHRGLKERQEAQEKDERDAWKREWKTNPPKGL